MKVVTRGVSPSERIWRGSCSRCGSVMEASESELCRKQSGNDRNEFYEMASETCPVCSSEFTMYPKR